MSTLTEINKIKGLESADLIEYILDNPTSLSAPDLIEFGDAIRERVAELKNRCTNVIITLRGGIAGLKFTPPKNIYILIHDYDVDQADTEEQAAENNHEIDEDGDTYWEYSA